jgi:uncharacterized membrane protein YadS
LCGRPSDGNRQRLAKTKKLKTGGDGFIAMVILNSVVTIPVAPKAWIVLGTTFLLSVALAAMSIATDFRKLRAEGLKPLLLAAAACLFISIFALVLVKVTAYS